MARNTGAVRFPDGSLMYFVYNGTVDTARPMLFDTAEQADDAWSLDQDRSLYGVVNPLIDEPVEVMPYFNHNDFEVMWISTANRQRRLITGKLSMD